MREALIALFAFATPILLTLIGIWFFGRQKRTKGILFNKTWFQTVRDRLGMATTYAEFNRTWDIVESEARARYYYPFAEKVILPTLDIRMNLLRYLIQSKDISDIRAALVITKMETSALQRLDINRYNELFDLLMALDCHLANLLEDAFEKASDLEQALRLVETFRLELRGEGWRKQTIELAKEWLAKAEDIGKVVWAIDALHQVVPGINRMALLDNWLRNDFAPFKARMRLSEPLRIN